MLSVCVTLSTPELFHRVGRNPVYSITCNEEIITNWTESLMDGRLYSGNMADAQNICSAIFFDPCN
jgi:hypothetical protein